MNFKLLRDEKREECFSHLQKKAFSYFDFL